MDLPHNHLQTLNHRLVLSGCQTHTSMLLSHLMCLHFALLGDQFHKDFVLEMYLRNFALLLSLVHLLHMDHKQGLWLKYLLPNHYTWL